MQGRKHILCIPAFQSGVDNEYQSCVQGSTERAGLNSIGSTRASDANIGHYITPMVRFIIFLPLFMKPTFAF